MSKANTQYGDIPTLLKQPKAYTYKIHLISVKIILNYKKSQVIKIVFQKKKKKSLYSIELNFVF